MKWISVIAAITCVAVQVWATDPLAVFPHELRKPFKEAKARLNAGEIGIDAVISIDGNAPQLVSLGVIRHPESSLGKVFSFDNAELQIEVEAKVLSVASRSATLEIKAVSGSRYLEAKGRDASQQTRLYSAARSGEMVVSPSAPAVIMDYQFARTTQGKGHKAQELSDVMIVFASVRQISSK